MVKININAEIESKALTDGIRFHGETSADNEACEKIKVLDSFIVDVLWELVRTKWQAESNSDMESSQEIRVELDRLFKHLEAMSDIYFGRDEE